MICLRQTDTVQGKQMIPSAQSTIRHSHAIYIKLMSESISRHGLFPAGYRETGRAIRFALLLIQRSTSSTIVWGNSNSGCVAVPAVCGSAGKEVAIGILGRLNSGWKMLLTLRRTLVFNCFGKAFAEWQSPGTVFSTTRIQSCIWRLPC